MLGARLISWGQSGMELIGNCTKINKRTPKTASNPERKELIIALAMWQRQALRSFQWLVTNITKEHRKLVHDAPSLQVDALDFANSLIRQNIITCAAVHYVVILQGPCH